MDNPAKGPLFAEWTNRGRVHLSSVQEHQLQKKIAFLTPKEASITGKSLIYMLIQTDNTISNKF